MIYEKILTRYNLIYKIKDESIICEVQNKESNKLYKFVLNSKVSRIEELANTNLNLLYILKYLYEDVSLILKKSCPKENFKDIELLKDVFSKDWLSESSLLKEHLKLLNAVKVRASVEGYSSSNSKVEIKFVMKYQGKQYTFYRTGNLGRDVTTSVNEEYLKVLINLKDSLIGKRKEDELFKRYNNLLLMKMSNYIQLSMLDSMVGLNKIKA